MDLVDPRTCPPIELDKLATVVARAAADEYGSAWYPLGDGDRPQAWVIDPPFYIDGSSLLGVSLPNPLQRTVVELADIPALAPDLIEQARAGRLRPTEIGSGHRAEAVLLGHDDLLAMHQARLLAATDPDYLVRELYSVSCLPGEDEPAPSTPYTPVTDGTPAGDVRLMAAPEYVQRIAELAADPTREPVLAAVRAAELRLTRAELAAADLAGPYGSRTGLHTVGLRVFPADHPERWLLLWRSLRPDGSGHAVRELEALAEDTGHRRLPRADFEFAVAHGLPVPTGAEIAERLASTGSPFRDRIGSQAVSFGDDGVQAVLLSDSEYRWTGGEQVHGTDLDLRPAETAPQWLPERLEQIRSGRFAAPVAIGTRYPEHVLLSLPQFRALPDADVRWRYADG